MAKSRNANSVGLADDEVLYNGSCKKNANDRSEQKMLIPKGLPNLGNTCFFNATIQCLLNTQPVSFYLDYLKRLEHVTNKHRYSTTVNDKLVDVPIAQIPVPEFSMPMVSAFEDMYRQFRDGRALCPRTLFAQISRKAPRFRGFSQQDAHELLRYLMDGLRQEEVDRFKRAFAKFVEKNDRPCKTKEEREAIMMEYKAYLDGSARPIVDAVFGGLLQQSIKCLNCGFISIRYEPFFDLSLSLQHNRERDNYPIYVSRKHLKMEKQRSEDGGGGRPQKMSKHKKKKEQKNKKKKNKKTSCGCRDSSCTKDDNEAAVAFPDIEKPNGADSVEPEADVEAAAESSENNSDEEEAEPKPTRCASRLADEDDIAELAELSDPITGGHSMFNSLRRFIMPELLSGPNAYECEKCCVRKKGESSSVNRRSVEASKRYLISKPPLILTLHLKRFEQTFMFGRMTTKKFRGIIGFTDTLDLAPFCRRSVKDVSPNQKQVLYSLYGIVSHSGDLNGGHYVAYVKARPQMETLMRRLFDRSVRFEPDCLSDIIAEKCKRLSLVQPDDCNNNNGVGEGAEKKTADRPKCNGTIKENSAREGSGNLAKVEAEQALQAIASDSKWYYVSDSSVQAVSTTRAFDTEAYILFYERVY